MYSILIRIPLIKEILEKRNFKKVATKVIHNEGLKVDRKSTVNLRDGSVKEDIKLGKNVWMFGTLQSQNHGKITMGDFSKIGPGCTIQCVDSVTIGDYTAIAINVFICDNNNHPINPEYRLYMRMQSETDDSRMWRHSDHAPIHIGKNCWIGQNVRIQKGVTIGDNSVIAANSVVTKSVPANCIAAGNPAKVVKTDIDKIPAPTTCDGFNNRNK